MASLAQVEKTEITGDVGITPFQSAVNGTPVNGHAHNDIAPARKLSAEEKEAAIAIQEQKHPRKLIIAPALTLPVRIYEPIPPFDQARADANAAERGGEVIAIAKRTRDQMIGLALSDFIHDTEVAKAAARLRLSNFVKRAARTIGLVY